MKSKPSRVQSELLKGKSLGQLIGEGLQEYAAALTRDPVAAGKEFTCRQISLEVTPTHYTPDLVKATRRLLGASQAVFARFLGVSLKTVHAWEQGINVPTDSAARFMDEIRVQPAYFQSRLASMAVQRRQSRSAS